nr:hypothetical protein [uncultured Ottowia sp.]
MKHENGARQNNIIHIFYRPAAAPGLESTFIMAICAATASVENAGH